jgi:hypothetical protein
MKARTLFVWSAVLTCAGAAHAVENLVFTPLPPCRVVNTNLAGGVMQVGVPRNFVLGGATTNYTSQGGSSTGCGIPGISTNAGSKLNVARAVSVNLVAVNATGNGHFRAWPTDLTVPNASVINYAAIGTNLANAIILPMCTTEGAIPCASGDITFQAFGSNAHLVVDVLGYFTAGSSAVGAPGNVALGRNALDSATTGNDNVALGREALTDNSVGASNIAIGAGALSNHTSYDENIAIGRDALLNDVAGEFNIAVGLNALSGHGDGISNIGIGRRALTANTTGRYNIAVGSNVARTLIEGYYNVVIGAEAMSQATSGSGNIAIGAYAGDNILTGSNDSIWIGNYGVAGDTNRIRIGIAQAATFIAGIRGVAVTGGHTVLIDANGQLGSVNSSMRGKQDVTPVGDASAALYALRPVAFRYKEQVSRGDDELQYGLIAEEVAESFPELATYDATGRADGVRYHLLVPLLLNELQRVSGELAAIVREQQEENRQLREVVGRLKAQQSALLVAGGN